MVQRLVSRRKRKMYDENVKVKFIVVIISDWHTIISAFRDEPYFSILLNQKPDSEEDDYNYYHLQFNNTAELYHILTQANNRKLETNIGISINGDYVDIWIDQDASRVVIKKQAIQDTSVESIQEAIKILRKFT